MRAEGAEFDVRVVLLDDRRKQGVHQMVELGLGLLRTG